MPIIRGQVRGAHLPGKFLADETYQKKGKYKYFVVLQGDDHFSKHPFRAVALINSIEPKHVTTTSQHPVQDLSMLAIRQDDEILDHGYIDLSYIVMLSATDIRNSDYIHTLDEQSLRVMDRRLLAGLGVIAPRKPN
ncbi:hypothetical protein [Alicyclobacillus dauci]|uniref:mRNA interferase MazF n=1 Tax=Alicyclobacillus dauci TaxID=1475485 RepID=A0ABY6YWX9_9BACL|nr:hypothetical protein [Alicyclobacillus dauci]WAH35067.1 hypothetical protein NZD86_12085 [Alicyclobacillus dauci]